MFSTNQLRQICSIECFRKSQYAAPSCLLFFKRLTTLLLLFCLATFSRSLQLKPHRSVLQKHSSLCHKDLRCSSFLPITYRHQSAIRLYFSRPYDDDPKSIGIPRDEITDTSSFLLEQHVIASAQAQMDVSRVMKSLYEAEEDDKNPLQSNDLLFDSEKHGLPVSHLQVASAAAVVVGATVFVVSSHSIFITIVTSVGVWISAVLDADSLSGALARILGRSTLRSVQQSQPKLKAVARAVLTDDEAALRALQRRVQELEMENRALRSWKETRLQVEAALPRYTLPELKETAKFHGIAVGGSKMDLLWRLVEANKIYLD